MFVTGRAIDRQFRFVPNEETVQTIRYCLGVTLEGYGVQLHAFVWMSNHYHLVLTDVNGELPDFMRDLNSKIPRALNANRGNRGQNFARESYNLVVSADEEAILRHCAYTEANPCAAHLVEHARQWEGVSSAGMDYGEEQEVLRPDCGLWGEVEAREDTDVTRAKYRGSSSAPELVKIRLARPPCRAELSAGKLREMVYAQVEELEKVARKEREAEGRAVMGMERVTARHYKESAHGREQYFQSEPGVSGSRGDALREVREGYREFVRMYRKALKVFMAGQEVVFPLGTWWMRRCLGVECACGPP